MSASSTEKNGQVLSSSSHLDMSPGAAAAQPLPASVSSVLSFVSRLAALEQLLSHEAAQTQTPLPILTLPPLQPPTNATQTTATHKKTASTLSHSQSNSSLSNTTTTASTSAASTATPTATTTTAAVGTASEETVSSGGHTFVSKLSELDTYFQQHLADSTFLQFSQLFSQYEAWLDLVLNSSAAVSPSLTIDVQESIVLAEASRLKEMCTALEQISQLAQYIQPTSAVTTAHVETLTSPEFLHRIDRLEQQQQQASQQAAGLHAQVQLFIRCYDDVVFALNERLLQMERKLKRWEQLLQDREQQQQRPK